MRSKVAMFTVMAFCALALVSAQAAKAKTQVPAGVQAHVQKVTYTCPMHPTVTSDKPGKCPKCGMLLEAKTAAVATAPAKAKSAAAKPKVVSAICPVTGENIPDVTKAKGGKSVYKGKTYYFCCGSCKPKFDRNPEKYLARAASGKAKSK